MNVNIFKRVRVFQNSFFLSNLLKMKKPFSFYCSVMNDTKRNISWTSAVMINPVSQSESMTILQDLITELKSYGIPSVVLLVGVIYTARLIGKLEANITSHKEISSVKHSANKEAAEAKIASAEAKAAANKEAAEAKFVSTEAIVAANNKAAEAKIAANKEAAEAKIAANKEAAEAKFASTEAIVAANKEAAEAKIAANKEAAEAKFASTEAIIASKKYVNTEISKNAAIMAEIAALKDELAMLRKN
jgi:hypothetical protein